MLLHRIGMNPNSFEKAPNRFFHLYHDIFQHTNDKIGDQKLLQPYDYLEITYITLFQGFGNHL